jgi:predicted ester cyclase
MIPDPLNRAAIVVGLLHGVNMDRNEHLALYRRYLERCNQHLFDELGEFVAKEVGGSTEGLANYIKGCSDVVAAFPDYRWSLKHAIVDGDWLAARLIGTGTHAGNFRGVAPTGRTISTQEIVMYRFADGKIAECWGDLHTTVRDELVSGS